MEGHAFYFREAAGSVPDRVDLVEVVVPELPQVSSSLSPAFALLGDRTRKLSNSSKTNIN